MIIAFTIGSEIFPEMSSQSCYLATLRLVIMLEKKSIHYIVCLTIIVKNLLNAFSNKVIVSVEKTLSERNRLTIFKNILLSVMFLLLRLL